jgi:uncharacterized protein (UPF0332 family)
MIKDNTDRLNMIKYRLEQSKNVITEIPFQIKNKYFTTAVNRMYYGMYYSLTGLALLYKFETSKHLQLIGWFNKNFIKPNLIEFRHGNSIRNIFEKRQKGDYEPFIEFTELEVLTMYENMRNFINAIEKFIIDNQDKILNQDI